MKTWCIFFHLNEKVFHGFSSVAVPNTICNLIRLFRTRAILRQIANFSVNTSWFFKWLVWKFSVRIEELKKFV